MTAEDPAAGPRQNEWWVERAARLKQGRAAPTANGGLGYDQAFADLFEQSLKAASGCFKSFRKSLGADFEESLRDGLLGTGTRKGILYELEATEEPVGRPKAWLLKSLRRRLLDANDRVRPESLEARQAKREDGTPAIEPVAGPAETGPKNVWELPGDVRRTLSDSHVFAAIVLGMLAELPEGHPLKALEPTPLSRAAALWRGLSEYLERDVALDTDRERWSYDAPEVETSDNFERAWLATYFQHEEAPEYLGREEIPADGHGKPGQLFYQHKRRFKLAYQQAGDVARAIVQGADRQARDLARAGSSCERLPFEWDAAQHETLQ